MATQPTRILVVEDEAAHAEAILRSLEAMEGAETRVLTSLRAFRELAEDWTPHIALLDLNLPDGQATEVLPDPSGARPFPIIVMTSYGSEQTAVHALRSGALDYLVKSPETFSGLARTLERLLREWQGIAERKRAEEALREAHQFSQQIISGVQEGVIVYGLDLRYRVWNPFMERLSGLPASQVLGRKPLDVFPFLREAGILERLERSLTGERTESFDFRFQAGRQAWVSDTSAPLRNLKGEIIGVIGAVRDITERKQAEDDLRESERRVRAKLHAILTPEGDLGTLELSDIIDMAPIQDLMDHFFNLTRIGIGIIDLRGRVLVATGWQDICTRYHRAHPEACRNCQESDRVLSTGLAPGEIRRHKCKNSLWDIVTPIHVGARHVGNLFLGQFAFEDEVPDVAVFKAQAEQYGFDEADYLAALERIPRWRRETVDEVMGFYSRFATLISDLSYRSARLARALTERERSAGIMQLRLRLIDFSLTHSQEEVLAATLDEAEALTGSRISFYHALEAQQKTSRLEAWSSRETRSAVSPGGNRRGPEPDASASIECLQRRQAVLRNAAAPVPGRTPDGEVITRELVIPVFRGSIIVAILGVGNKASDYDQADVDSVELLADLAWGIAEQKRAQEQQRNLEAQLQQAQKMESLGSLAGGVAHDMNNVLGAILGLASASLGTVPNDSPAHKAFDTISKAAVRGGQMVKSLLSFARQSPAVETELDLNAILREEALLLERTTLAKVRLEMDLTPGLHPIRGDASALTHAFLNLCVNAVDAMSESGTLLLRTRNVGSEWIEVMVQDNGTGMPKAVLEKAMDPFFTTKAQGKGTGLGLSMVYSTVKAHQGQIEIQSEPGEGTCVRMRFPACKSLARSAEPVHEVRPEPPARGLNVLLVDDDELVQSAMQAVLETLGHRPVGVSSGEEALAELEAGLEPDVVILDMNMPGLGGSGSLPRLRALRPTVPVLLATGRADQAALSLVEAHPFVTMLSKPFSMKELQGHLAALARK